MTPEFLKKIDKTWTLFLDRDGVINKRILGGYIKSSEDFEFLPGVLNSLAFFTLIFNRIIIITNQQGVGKGIMTEAELIDLHTFMVTEVSKNNGGIDKIYYCTDLVNSFNSCRKPSIKMANKASKDFPEIDFSKSIMVGDSASDIEFGQNAGMKTVFVKSDYEINAAISSDYEVNSLHELRTAIEKLQ